MVTSEARKAYMKVYRQANKERLTATSKAYRRANLEKISAYNIAYQRAHKEAAAVAARKYYELNKEKRLARIKIYYTSNRESVLARKKVYARANPGKACAITAKRKAAKIQRTPNWLTPDDYHAIRTLYETAAALTKSTGIKHHVDHVIPLQGRTVSGFHCPTNLQILTATENQIKNNKFTGDK